MIRPAALLIAAVAGLAACASLPPEGVPLTGQWGGRHVGLTLGESSGQLDYDCAAGTIDGPLVPLRDGTFEAEGRHTPGTGGPEREGEVRPSYRALYSGAVHGTRMTLQARVENGALLGPFTLARDSEPILLRCL